MLSMEALANVILCEGHEISNKKIQKLSYYVYAWHLAIYRKEIADMTFEAWEHGPVCRSLYSQYRKYGWQTIPQYNGFIFASDEDIKFINAVLKVYDKYSADELEELTHSEVPWRESRKNYLSDPLDDGIISKQTIIDYYSKQTPVRDLILKEIA